MAILLKCVLLLAIMAIFCDCMNTPGKKGKSPKKSSDPIPIPEKKGKPSSSAANSPTVTEGTPKSGGKPKGKGAARSPAEKAHTPKALDTPEFYKTSPRKNKLNAINSPRKPNNGSPRNDKKALQKERHEAREQKLGENRFLRTKSTAGNTTDVETESEAIPTFIAEPEDSTVEYPTDNDHATTQTDLGGNDQQKALQE
uniref:GLAND18 n=1 Tax=Heterodera schachtii TaxID=97005 RepID=A0A2I4KAF0_HETSC|nr:GLAND18 [Heterodera schachtii]